MGGEYYRKFKVTLDYKNTARPFSKGKKGGEDSTEPYIDSVGGIKLINPQKNHENGDVGRREATPAWKYG